MHEGAPRDSGATEPATRSGIAARLGAALVIATSAAIAAERVLATSVEDVAIRGIVSVVVGAGLVGIGLWRAVVHPLVQSHEDLSHRYEAALADALTDPLTGLGNHRAFQEELDRQVGPPSATRCR
jgi:GGDEF domain-containing protein